MTTLGKLIGNINTTKDPGQQSPLEIWFENIIDITIDEFTVEDLCRAIRQKVSIGHLMPRVLEVLTEDPLAGEFYDGELIAALSMMKKNDLKDHLNIFFEIKKLLNHIPKSDIDDKLKIDIVNFNKLLE